jgi:hypothetical protein
MQRAMNVTNFIYDEDTFAGMIALLNYKYLVPQYFGCRIDCPTVYRNRAAFQGASLTRTLNPEIDHSMSQNWQGSFRETGAVCQITRKAFHKFSACCSGRRERTDRAAAGPNYGGKIGAGRVLAVYYVDRKLR